MHIACCMLSRARRDGRQARRSTRGLSGPRLLTVLDGCWALISAQVQQRLAAAAAAEDDKMAAFRALLSKGPIQIAKRQ